jgi:hypothetical protein
MVCSHGSAAAGVSRLIMARGVSNKQKKGTRVSQSPAPLRFHLAETLLARYG